MLKVTLEPASPLVLLLLYVGACATERARPVSCILALPSIYLFIYQAVDPGHRDGCGPKPSMANMHLYMPMYLSTL